MFVSVLGVYHWLLFRFDSSPGSVFHILLFIMAWRLNLSSGKVFPEPLDTRGS